MFKRGWLGFGKIRSDEGFVVYYGHKSVNYSDERGDFQIGYEDGLLFPDSAVQISDSVRQLRPIRKIPQDDKALIVSRILSALEWDGEKPRVWTTQLDE